MSNILKWVLVILVVVAAVFGYQIYMQNAVGNPVVASPNVPASTPAVTTPSTPSTPSTPANTTTSTVTDPKVLALLDSPSNTASESEKQAYADRIIKAVVKTATIDVSSCVAQPTVSGLVNSSDVVFSNGDSVEHRVVFNADTFFIVPPKSSKTVKADFGKGPGIYGFGCDNSQKAVGMVFVTVK